MGRSRRNRQLAQATRVTPTLTVQGPVGPAVVDVRTRVRQKVPPSTTIFWSFT